MRSSVGAPIEDAVDEALCTGWIDSTLRPLDDARSQILFAPRRSGSTWSQRNKARVGQLAAQGLVTALGQAAVDRAQADGSWTVLDEIDALTIPPDLAAALATEPGAQSGFDGWSVSDRKQYL